MRSRMVLREKKLGPPSCACSFSRVRGACVVAAFCEVIGPQYTVRETRAPISHNMQRMFRWNGESMPTTHLQRRFDDSLVRHTEYRDELSTKLGRSNAAAQPVDGACAIHGPSSTHRWPSVSRREPLSFRRYLVTSRLENHSTAAAIRQLDARTAPLGSHSFRSPSTEEIAAHVPGTGGYWTHL